MTTQTMPDPKMTASGARPTGPEEPRTPKGDEGRVVTLDAIRGLAILGILPANLPAFALPAAAAMQSHYASPHWSEAVAEGAVQTFVTYKFMTIFSLLFGVGLALQRGRAERAGRPFAAFYAWRLVLLAGIGAAHGWLVWYGDILFWYAITGFVALALSRLRARILFVLGGAAVLVPVLLCLAGAALLIAMVVATGDSPGIVNMGPTTAAEALADPAARTAPIYDLHAGAETIAYRDGGYLDQLAFRLMAWAYLMATYVVWFGWRILGLFLIGMGLQKVGFFTRPEDHRTLQNCLIGVGLLIGLPLEAVRAVAWAAGLPGPIELPATLLIEAIHQIASLSVSLAIIALFVRLAIAWKPLVAIGRTALSCYLAESAIAVTIFYSFGAGQFGEVTRAQLWAIGAAIWATILIGASIWTRFFRFGPVEWAWRSAAYGKRQPMRR